jgi:hypothetical protein
VCLAAGPRRSPIIASTVSIDAARHLGDRHSEGTALINLGIALRQARRLHEAIAACQDAVAIFRQISDEHRERIALGDLETARAAQWA